MIVPFLPYNSGIPEQPCFRGQRLRVVYPNVAHQGIVYSVQLVGTATGYAWYVMVAHNSKAGDGVCLVTLETFAHGCMVNIVDSPRSAEHTDFIIGQADRALAAGIKYFLLYQNCEHFASWCYTGAARSQTLNSAATVACGAVAIGALMAALRSPSWATA